MKKLILFTFTVFVFMVSKLNANEGMWIPLLIDELNYEDLRANGFKLTSEDIYSINQACLIDAVVLFNGTCSGELISKNGLVLTNHHCGFDAIQKHSTVEKNHLKHGFWAQNISEELPNKELYVKFLLEIKPFSKAILENYKKGLNQIELQDAIRIRIDSLEQAISDSLNLEVSIEKFYEGNSYYLFIYKEYTDVRLVGAPPMSIGNFGADRDNWVWPRHTGDFSLFRIYTGPDGEPAEYSKDNIPFVPKKFLTISAQGIKKNDFTIVLGYPGSTQEYLYSAELDLLGRQVNPNNIKLRAERLKIIDKAREEDENIYIQYATKQKKISNAWKKWKGIQYGFDRFDVIENRRKYEAWLLDHARNNKLKLQEVFDDFDVVYLGYAPYLTAMNYYRESLLSIEPLLFYKYSLFEALNKFDMLGEDANKIIEEIKLLAQTYFRNYNFETDVALSKILLQSLKIDIGEEFQPESINELADIESLNKLVDKIYSKSILTDSVRFFKALNKIKPDNLSVFRNDPFVILNDEIANVYYNNIISGYYYYKDQLDNLYKEYQHLIGAIDTLRIMYPDANSTMRMTYGKIEGYSPSDAVEYSFQTYLEGVIEKATIFKDDYVLSDKLLALYENQDYGKYATDDGRLPVCFLASNHTSGGNSGSPVLNADGRLIGINFDRTWEGTMSDYNFDEEICRNISVDIRYVLFIIDKFADCKYLLDEMDIIW